MNIRSLVAKRHHYLFQPLRAAIPAGAILGALFLTAQTNPSALGQAVAPPPARRLLSGHVPAIIRGLQPAGRIAGTTPLRLAIGLRLRDQVALTDLLNQLYDPASPNYRRYLTPEQFGAQFGPAEADYQAVVAFAQANHLTVTGAHSNRMLLDVEGSAADIENAFQITLRTYQHPTENRTFFASDVEPSVPSTLVVADISGLSDYGRPHPKFKLKPANQSSKVAPKNGTGPGGTFRGLDFRTAYVPDTTLNGAGQTVALVQFDGYYANDITDYEIAAGLPNVTLENVLLNGFSGIPTGNGGEVEVSLDIEMVISMAPGLSKVILYEGDPVNFHPNDVLNRIATDNSARQISSSWGWIGGPNATTDQIFQQMAAQGQTYFNASGDSDAFTFGQVDDPTGFGEPSGSPFITQVGGTTLTTSSSGAWVSETVWNWGNEFGDDGVGSSGGISLFYPLPTWQQGIDMSLNQGSIIGRNIPDVALTADNIFVIADNGVQMEGVGGTSVAAPLWGGFIALVNQQAANTGQPSVGFINPVIYAIGKGTTYSADFHDTTTGDNTWSGSPTKFFAVSHYDLCTGWGTPAGQSLITALTGASVGSGLLQMSVNPPSGANLINSTTQAIFVTVSDTFSVTHATVTAAIPGITNLTFLDDGQPPDVSTNDGIYSAQFQVPAALGPITMTVSATATNEIGITNVINYTIISLPLNDNFANATKVPTNGAVYFSNNKFATLEPGEPRHAGVSSARGSLWWNLTPAASTNFFVDTTGSAIDTVLAVYTGPNVSNLVQVAATNDVGSSKQARLKFNATSGILYHIAVAGANSNSLGSLNLAITAGGSPDTNAPLVLVTSPLSGLWVSNRIVTISGTASDPPANSSGLSQVILTVNNQWTFTAIGTTNWSCLIALKPGLNNIRVMDQDVAGNVSAPVNLQLTFVPPPNPDNDLFANAISLTNNSGTFFVGTTNATAEFGEPAHAGTLATHSVWYSFVPTVDGVLTLNTTNSDFDTVLALYTGATVGNLTLVASDDDAFAGAPGGYSLISQAVRSNVAYRIAVDGYGGASGNVSLSYSFAPAAVYRLTVSNSIGGNVQATSTNSLGGVIVMQGPSGDFAGGTQVELTATPSTSYQFDIWSGSEVSLANPILVVMNGDRTVAASFVLLPFTDSFESGNFLQLPWTNAGAKPWIVQTNIIQAGKYAARSGSITNNQSSSLILSANFRAGNGSFGYRVSSELNFDFLNFYVDGALLQQWSGEFGWANYIFPLAAGLHTLEWRYTKDVSGSSGMDAAFIDDVTLPLVVSTNSSSPAKLQINRQADGTVFISLSGQTNQQYVFQTSTNLLNWQNASTNIFFGGFLRIPDPASASNQIQFYRAIVIP